VFESTFDCLNFNVIVAANDNYICFSHLGYMGICKLIDMIRRLITFMLN
jgi:hypothetical protein